MSGEHTELGGQDFTRGIRRSEVLDGGMVVGHAHGKPVLVARRAAEVLASGASDEGGAATIAPSPVRHRGDAGDPAHLRSEEPFAVAPSADPDRAEFELLVRRQLELLGEDPDGSSRRSPGGCRCRNG